MLGLDSQPLPRVYDGDPPELNCYELAAQTTAGLIRQFDDSLDRCRLLTAAVFSVAQGQSFDYSVLNPPRPNLIAQ